MSTRQHGDLPTRDQGVGRSWRRSFNCKIRMLSGAIVASIFFAVSASGSSFDGSTNDPYVQLADMNIEDLVNVEVTSVSSVFKKMTRIDQAPAAVAVVTSEEIRRLGITTVPEALRTVPGLNVARISSHEWAVSARGFNAQFANKLLILVDGRTVYGPAYGGVFWGMQDMMIEDIDRIEVIRGPGASLWGANAVNGVINVLTKSAKHTQGALASASFGTEDQPSISVRHGGVLATNLYYRVWGKYFDRDGLVTSDGNDARDDWRSLQGGLRLDWEPTDADTVSLIGNYYNDFVHDNENVVILTPPYVQNTNVVNHDYGGNVLLRWTRAFSEESSLTLQAYYDHFKQEQVGTSETRDTFDFDAQHRFRLGSRHDIIWGAAYHYTSDDFPANFFLTWTPPRRDDNLYSAFLQDEIALAPERLFLTLGTKFEHNSYTGFEYEPSGRLLWTPNDRQTYWGAVSRAVRTPSRYETGARVNYSVSEIPSPPFPTPLRLISLFGNPELESETVTSYELGYRVHATKRLSFDIAAHYNEYEDLVRFVPESGFVQGPLTVFSHTAQNSGRGITFGTEISAHWRVTDNWRLSAGYAWLETDFEPDDEAFVGNPRHQANLRSYLDLPGNVELNGAVYYVDSVVAAAGLGTKRIPSYVRLDLGVIWRPTRNFEFGVWGQNLLDERHPEFPSLKSSIQTEVPRQVLGKVTWKF